MVQQPGACHVLFVLYFIYYFFFSFFFFSNCLQWGPTRAAQQRGTGQRGRRAGGWEGEVEGQAEEGNGGGGGQGAETGRRRKKRRGRLREGGFDERMAVTAEEEDERASQSRGWATLLLSCLLLGFEISKVQ